MESFNDKFGEYCLDMRWFRTLHEAGIEIEGWRKHYNEEKPYSLLGRMQPRLFAELCRWVKGCAGLHWSEYR